MKALTEYLTERERMLLRGAAADVATLPDRLAANEERWGPGCRPELRERLATARATVERLRRAATERADHADATRFDAERAAFNRLTLTDGGREHLAWNDNGTNAVCGTWIANDPAALGARLGTAVRLWEVLDGDDRPGAANRCRRCTAAVRAWWND
jgi:hypothetical protein